jgi:hypothetical protein
VFDAIDAHPWVGTQLARGPWQSRTLQVFERIGRRLQALRVPDAALFTAASALLNYILGVAGQNADNTEAAKPGIDRTEYLDAMAAEWERLDADEYAFTRTVADQLRRHDDRAEFLAGIDLILAGITGTSAGTGGSGSR